MFPTDPSADKARYLSFRFDDGFITGARKAIERLSPDKASFFVITGLLADHLALKDLPYFDGPDFGSIEEWRDLSRAGHDIQPHGHRHINYQETAQAEQIHDLTCSLAIMNQVHDRPKVFCFPYNLMTPLDLRDLGVSAAGFRSRTSDEPILFNRMDQDLDPFALQSWAVRERNLDAVARQLANDVPDGTWTILAFHSLDGEGFEPWGSAAFGVLVQTVRQQGFHIRTVGQMVDHLAVRDSQGAAGQGL